MRSSAIPPLVATYDRDLGEVLATDRPCQWLANALRVTLLGTLTARSKWGGTRNLLRHSYRTFAPRRGTAGSGPVTWPGRSEKEVSNSVSAFTEAIRADPDETLRPRRGRLSLALRTFPDFVADPEFCTNLKRRKRWAQSDCAGRLIRRRHFGLGQFFRLVLSSLLRIQEYERSHRFSLRRCKILEDVRRLFSRPFGRTEAAWPTLTACCIGSVEFHIPHCAWVCLLAFARATAPP